MSITTGARQFDDIDGQADNARCNHGGSATVTVIICLAEVEVTEIILDRQNPCAQPKGKNQGALIEIVKGRFTFIIEQAFFQYLKAAVNRCHAPLPNIPQSLCIIILAIFEQCLLLRPRGSSVAFSNADFFIEVAVINLQATKVQVLREQGGMHEFEAR